MPIPSPMLQLGELDPRLVPTWLAELDPAPQRITRPEQLAAVCGVAPGATVLTSPRGLAELQYWLAESAACIPALRRAAVVVFAEGSERMRVLLDGADLVLCGGSGAAERDRLLAIHRAQGGRPRVLLVAVDGAPQRRDAAAARLAAAGCEVLDEAESPDAADLALCLAGDDICSQMGALVELRRRLAAGAPLLLAVPRAAAWMEAQARLHGADAVLEERVDERAFLRALWRWWERRWMLRGGATLALAESTSGRLRREEFRALLDRRLQGAAQPWQALLSIRIDQAAALQELGLGTVLELERQFQQCVAACMQPSDAWTAWLEFSVGVAARRDDLDGLKALVAQLGAAVANAAFAVRGQAFELTASIGIALPPAGAAARDPDRWFAAAHAAEAIARRLGGNRSEGILEAGPRRMPDERALIVREWLKEAAKGRQIQIEFQPALLVAGGRGADAPFYLLHARLRDPRAPLGGVPREEYIEAARAQGAQAVIDRTALFNAFETLAELGAPDSGARLLVPLDLASFNHMQQQWFEAELKRRAALAAGLLIEFEADEVLQRPALAGVVHWLRRLGLRLALREASGSLVRIGQLPTADFDWLHLPFAALRDLDRSRLDALVSPWRSDGRGLVVDGVERFDQLPLLKSLGVERALGDALAAAGLRPDYEFQLELR